MITLLCQMELQTPTSRIGCRTAAFECGCFDVEKVGVKEVLG